MAGVPEKPKRNMEIVVLRNKGYTFDEIADKLLKRYGGKRMARQTVFKLYNRHKDKYADIADIAASS